jgi:hypothetical protein
MGQERRQLVVRSGPFIGSARSIKNVLSYRAGTGFKLNVVNLRHLEVNLGEYTTQPFAATAISIDGGAYFTANFSTGSNVVPLSDAVLKKENKATTLVEINVQGWQNNRIQFRNITVNSVGPLPSSTEVELSFIWGFVRTRNWSSTSRRNGLSSSLETRYPQ